MQHVNVCLQALLKRLGKACREKEGVGRSSLWKETLEKINRGRKIPCAQSDRQQQGMQCQQHNMPHNLPR